MPQVSVELVKDLKRPKYPRKESEAQRKDSVDRIFLKTHFVTITTLHVSTVRVCCIVCLVFEVFSSSKVFTSRFIVENNETVKDKVEEPYEDCGE